MPNLPREKNFSFAASLSSAAKVVDFRSKAVDFRQKVDCFCRKSSKNAFRTASFATLFSSALENQRMPPEGSQKNRIFAR